MDNDKVAIISIIAVAVVVLSVAIFINTSSEVTGNTIYVGTLFCCGGSATDFRITANANCEQIAYYSQRSWKPYCFSPAKTCDGYCRSKGLRGMINPHDSRQCICGVMTQPTISTIYRDSMQVARRKWL